MKRWIIVIQKSEQDNIKGLLATSLVYCQKYNIDFYSFRSLQNELWIFAKGTGYDMIRIKNDISIPILRISKHVSASFLH